MAVQVITRVRVAAITLSVVASTSLLAQQIFRSGTDVVSLNITVTDAGSHFVTKLPQDQFQVYEDGVMQDISYFSAETQPVALSLLLDTSESMENKLSVVQEAAIGFVRRLKPNDLAEIVDFDSRVNILQGFTGDRDPLERAIMKTTAGGSTSLYNAVYIAINALKKTKVDAPDQIRRQAIVLLSDGEDTSSLMGYEEVLDLAKRSEVIVYAVGLRSKNDVPTKGFNEADFVLRTIAQETGGRPFFVDHIEQLSSIYQQIADELASQYLIGYSSKNRKRDGAWRNIVVRVTPPGLTTRTKRGYFGPTGHP